MCFSIVSIFLYSLSVINPLSSIDFVIACEIRWFFSRSNCSFVIFTIIPPSQNLSLKENRSDCRFAASGAVRWYRPEQKVVIWAILFKLILRLTGCPVTSSRYPHLFCYCYRFCIFIPFNIIAQLLR